MTEWSLPEQEAVAEALNYLRGKWTVPVMTALALGERQNKDILASINDNMATDRSSDSSSLSPRVLADTLQRAAQDGLVERHAEEGTFGAVRYRLTTKGRELLRAVLPLAEWALKYCKPS